MESRRKLERELSRKKILLAVADIVSSRGTQFATISNIAELAGCSRSLVAFYFPKKSEIFPTLIQSILREGYGFFEEGLSDLDAKGTLSLTEIVMLNLRFFQKNPSYAKVMQLMYYQSSYSLEIKAIATRTAAGFIERVELACRAGGTGVHPRMVAEILHSFTIGAITRFFSLSHGHTEATYELLIREQLRVLLGPLENSS
jgi:AcrR family transcriptional regulator